MVVTSPPYGASVHGHVTAIPGRGVAKRNDRYAARRRGDGNLAHTCDAGLLDAFTGILAAARSVLRPGGIVVVTARPWRRNGALVDFPAAVMAAGTQAGLEPLERNVALLAGLRGDRLVSRALFFQLHQVRAARTHGVALRVIAHEDVLVLRDTTTS
jgi:modification methylase